MGAGGSSNRRASAVGALDGAPVFQQRSQDTSGALKGTKGVSVDDSYDGDFSDISYSEGGGIISHQDFPIKNGNFCHQHTGVTPCSSTSMINPTTTNHPFDPSPLPPPTPNNNLSDDSDKENNLHQHPRYSHLPPFRVGGLGDSMSLCESSVGVTPHGARILPRLQRAQSHDVRTSGPFFSGVNHSAGSNSRNSSPTRPRAEEKGGTVIEKRASEMSFLITPPPPDHAESPDMSKRDVDGGSSGSSNSSSSNGSTSQKQLQPLSEDIPLNKGDMTVEEVA